MKKSIVSLFLLISCQNIHTEIVNYVGYYDDTRKIKEMEGKLINGSESGEWIFYSKNGNVNQSGIYLDGLQDSVWTYKIDGIDSSILWKQVNDNNRNFSLPSGFYYYPKMSDSTKDSYLDSTTHTLFVVTTINCDHKCIQGYYDITLGGFKKEFTVLEAKSTKIDSKYGQFFFDDYLLHKSDYENDIREYMVYKPISNDKVLVLTIVNQKAYDVFMKFMISEVFYHIKYNSKRIIFPQGEKTFDQLSN